MNLKADPNVPVVSHSKKHIPSLTLTRSDIADIISRKTDLSRPDSADFLESMIGHITNELIAGKTVKLAGFGVFSTREKSERPGRNPKTGEPAMVGARRVLAFKASKQLKGRVNTRSKT